MRCRTLLTALVLTVISESARAHQSEFRLDTLAGSGNLTEASVSGQYGFKHHMPIYLAPEFRKYVAQGDAKRNVPRQDANRWALEAGFEGKRIGVAARYEGMRSSGFDVGFDRFGGQFQLRFLPLVSLNKEEEELLSRADRKALLEQREREYLETVPKSPVLLLDFDTITVNSPLALAGGMQATRASVALHWKIRPWWLVLPRYQAYSWSHSPKADIGADAVFSSRLLRTTRIGARGPYSGVFGAPTSTQQLYMDFKVDPRISFVCALTYIQLITPDDSAISLYVSFPRRLGQSKKVTIVPAYEHARAGEHNFGFLSLSLQFELNETYIP